MFESVNEPKPPAGLNKLGLVVVATLVIGGAAALFLLRSPSDPNAALRKDVEMMCSAVNATKKTSLDDLAIYMAEHVKTAAGKAMVKGLVTSSRAEQSAAFQRAMVQTDVKRCDLIDYLLAPRP